MTDYQIWPATSGPGSSFPDASVNLATEFFVSTNAWVKAIRFWRADTNVTGTVQGRVWQAINSTSGTAVAGTDVTFTLVGTGWQQADIVTPVPITAGVRYKVACLFPSGYSATGDYWSSGPGGAGITNGILTAPNQAGSVGGSTQGCFAYNVALTYPDNGSPNAGNYWVDVVVTDVDPAGNVVDVGQAVELSIGQAITPAHTGTVGQATEINVGGVIVTGSAVPTTLRTRVSGTESTRFTSGNEPPFRVSGNEEGT